MVLSQVGSSSSRLQSRSSLAPNLSFTELLIHDGTVKRGTMNKKNMPPFYFFYLSIGGWTIRSSHPQTRPLSPLLLARPPSSFSLPLIPPPSERPSLGGLAFVAGIALHAEIQATLVYQGTSLFTCKKKEIANRENLFWFVIFSANCAGFYFVLVPVKQISATVNICVFAPKWHALYIIFDPNWQLQFIDQNLIRMTIVNKRRASKYIDVLEDFCRD